MDKRLVFLGLLLLGVYGWYHGQVTAADGHVQVYVVKGIINPAIVEYMQAALARAAAEKAMAVVFQLDTPGGLSEPRVRLSKPS